MLKRREFIIKVGSVLLVLPAAGALSACGDDGGYQNGPNNGNNNPQGTTLRFTSSVDSGHTHTIDINNGILLMPPMQGFAGVTSNTGDHTHMIELSNEELSAINAGTTITKETTNDAGHIHTFTFAKGAAVTY